VSAEEPRPPGSESSSGLVKWVEGQRGLWFTAYIAPWANVGLMAFYMFSAMDKDVVRTPAGFAVTAILSLLLGLLLGVPTWYGISRFRLWGWYFVMGSMVLGLIDALYGIVMDTAHQSGSLAGQVVGPIVWMSYLSKRKHLFHRKEAHITPSGSSRSTMTKWIAPKTNWIWPKIHDEASAKTAVHEAVGYTLVVAISTAGIATASLIMGHPILGFEVWNYFDAALAGVLAFGIWKYSRVVAVMGLLYWVCNLLMKWYGGRAGIITLLILLGFVHGVRGTFAYQKYRSHSTEQRRTQQGLPDTIEPRGPKGK
jgi:hypothetical protein